MCAEFASLDGMGGNIPNASPNMDRLGLTVPGDVITGTTAGMQALGAQNIKTDASRQRIVVNDSNTNRVSFGRIGTGVNDWGLKVSKTGINVDTATNDQLVFNSSQDVFKIVSTGTANIAAASPQTNQSTIVTHNLGFVPMCLAFITYTSGFTVQLPYIDPGPPAGAGTIRTLIDIYTTTSTTIQFEVVNYSASISTGLVTIKYYLLQETAT